MIQNTSIANSPKSPTQVDSELANLQKLHDALLGRTTALSEQLRPVLRSEQPKDEKSIAALAQSLVPLAQTLRGIADTTQIALDVLISVSERLEV